MATQEQLAYRHKKYSQRKRSRDDGSTAYSTDSDSSLEPDQENFNSNLPKQRRVQSTKLTPKQKFKAEKAINELRIRIQQISLNDNEPETIGLTKDDSEVKFVRIETTPSAALRAPSATKTNTTDSNGNLLNNFLAKRGRPQISTNTPEIEKESLSDDEINEKLIKLEMPLPMGPPPNRRVTFGGFSHSSESPKKTKLVTFGACERSAESTKNTEHNDNDKERIKFSSKKMGRSKTIKQINIEDEWKSYKNANLSWSEFATRTSSFGTK